MEQFQACYIVIQLNQRKLKTKGLLRSCPSNKVYHIHKFYFRNLERQLSIKELIFRLKYTIEIKFFSLLNREIYVISGHREPKSRIVSAFFQNYSDNFRMLPRNFEEVKLNFISVKNTYINNTINWNKLELERKFNFKLSDTKKLTPNLRFIKRGNIKLFWYRLEGIDDLINELVSEGFIDAKAKSKNLQNTADNKWYKEEKALMHQEIENIFDGKELVLLNNYEKRIQKIFENP